MHFEQMGVDFILPGKEPIKKARPGHEYLAPNRITKSQMTRWVKKSGLDDYTKDELLKQLAQFPANTMHKFYKDIHKYIQKIHQDRREKENKKDCLGNSDNEDQS